MSLYGDSVTMKDHKVGLWSMQFHRRFRTQSDFLFASVLFLFLYTTNKDNAMDNPDLVHVKTDYTTLQ